MTDGYIGSGVKKTAQKKNETSDFCCFVLFNKLLLALKITEYVDYFYDIEKKIIKNFYVNTRK